MAGVLVAALAAALAVGNGSDAPEDSSRPVSTAPAAAHSAPSGVGDSRTDDPSDDEPERGEP